MPPDFREFLLQRELIPGRELERAVALASESGDPLGLLLSRLGLISESELAQAYACCLNIPRFAANARFGDAEIEGLSTHFLRASRLVPFLGSDGKLALAMSDPEDDFAARAVEFAAGAAARRHAATLSEVEAAIDRLHAPADADGAPAAEHFVDSEDIDRLKDLASEAPVIRMVQRLVTQAIERKASDIHIEPMEDCLSVRYRVDGMLQEVERQPAYLKPAVVSRIKIMAHLNIAEHRLPQDGRFRLTVHGRETDFRVATSPTLHGESVVLRILDRRDVALDFTALGFEAGPMEQLRRALQRPHGIVLVTGPTGSGKTTTLYAALKELNSPDRKILTAEDPIEYMLERVNQVQVKPQIGHDFAHALRSFLRQDPDVIMVGEIRDVETARIAIQASLTGHLLLSTLHTNSAAGAVTRLLDMGIEDYLLSSTLALVLGQRLVRRLCAHCSVAYQAPPALLQRFGLAPAAGATLCRAGGCAACGGTGFSGRIAVTEVLEVDDEIRKLIMARADSGAIERQAVAAGMLTMSQDGLVKALAGLTTVEEVLRVAQA